MKTMRTPRTVLAVGASVVATVAMAATAVAAPGGTGAPTGNDGGTGAVTAAPAPQAPPAVAHQVVPQINQAVQPLRTQAPATPQYTPVSTPREVVIDNRPVIVQEVVVQEVTVEETSPGLLILNPEVQRDINPVNVWNKIDSNTKGEDRQTLALAAGAGAAGAVGGGLAGATVGALGTGVTGAAAGAVAGGAASGAAVAPLCAVGSILAGPVAAGVPCLITAGATGAVAGAAIGGAAGLGAGAVAGGAAGAAAGAAAAADSVPNARTAAQRVAGDVIWELEDEARVNNGYEPLVGEKPSENLDYSEPGSENLGYIPEDVSLNPETAVQQVVNQAVEDYQPVVPPAPQLPEQVPNAQQFNDTANSIQQDVQTNVTNGYNAFKNDVNNAQAAAANIQNDILSAQDAIPSFPSL